MHVLGILAVTVNPWLWIPGFGLLVLNYRLRIPVSRKLALLGLLVLDSWFIFLAFDTFAWIWLGFPGLRLCA